jgi:GLPGLI family protein
LVPRKMTLKFRKNLFAAEMSTMGVFNTSFIADPKKKTITQLVRVFDVKQACIYNEKLIQEDNDAYKLEFQETKETKVIAGYKCKKVIATGADDPTIKFDVYYTDQLNVTSPNLLGPYSKLGGMLMEYRLKKFGLEMIFTATEVRKEEVPDETFELPSYYKIISKTEMEEYFKAIQ